MTTLDAIFDNSPMATDPVCKMEVDKTNPPGGTAEHEGKTYYFCAPGCRQTFLGAPATYAER